MASRFLLHLRAGASAAARSARGHHLPASRTWAAAMAPTIGAFAEAGSFTRRIPAVQGVRHYGTPSNHSITELKRTMRKVERRLDALEGKSDIGLQPFQEVLKNHEKEHKFHRFAANVITAVGCCTTFSVIMYYRIPWHVVLCK